MPDITISTKEEEKKENIDTQVKKAFLTAQELENLKKINDDFEKEIQRTRELIQLGGKSMAGQYTPEKNAQELAKEEAANLIKRFR